jgi:hypothetical protein
MNNLWFTKFESKDFDRIVFIYTLPEGAQNAEAEAKGRTHINPDYEPDYKLIEARIICRTPDEVVYDEPV